MLQTDRMFSHLKRSLTPFRFCFRSMITPCTRTAIETDSKKTKTRRRIKSSELKEYLKKLQILQQNPTTQDSTWGTNYIRVKRGPQSSLYLVEKVVSEEIKGIIQSQNLDSEGTVIEINPGFGILTSHLKNDLGFSHINCFEDDKNLGPQLLTNFGVTVIPVNFISLPRLHHADIIDGEERVSTNLSKINRGNSKLYILGATASSSLVNFTIRTLVTQRVIFEDFSWDGIAFFIALSAKTTTIITSTPKSLFTLYRPASVLFQLLFHHEVLGTLPRHAFLPWETRDAGYDLKDPAERYKKIRIPYDPTVLSFLHFRPNISTVNKVGRDKLIHLWYFIRHNLHSRRNAVIPQLEQWIPGCGPRLIRQGFTIFTQFGTLTPSQILDLYFQFISWPEYNSSSFVTAVEKFQSKLDTSEEDIFDLPKPI